MTKQLHFIPIEIQHRTTFLPYLEKRSMTCDRTFTNLFCWQHYFHTSWTEVNDWLVVRAYINGERRAAYIVFSKSDTPDYSEILPLLEADAAMLGLPLTLMGLAECECEMLRCQYPDAFLFDKNRDFADYVYLAENLRMLKGRKYAQKRNHVNKFKSLYSYHYEPITESNLSDCIALEEEWMEQHGDDESAAAECLTIQNAFRHYEELDLTGGVLYVENQPVAFTYGSPVNDEMFCTHVEKGDIRYEGVYQMINHLFAQHLPENYKFINREEDMGIAGLRKSKMSYEPSVMMYKTTALKLTSEMRDIIYIWKRCFGETDLSVHTFLSRYYFTHCTFMEQVDGHVVATVFMVPCQTEYGLGAYLYGIATLPEYRSKGLSSSLIRRMLDECRDRGASFTFLIPADLELVGFYEQFGYVATQTRVEFCCDMDLGSGEKEKDRIMVLPLCDNFKPEDLPEVLTCTPML